MIKPRLNDYFNIPFTQEEVNFAIPFLDEDIPLYLDPFLLWNSPSLQDNSLHTVLANSFNAICNMVRTKHESDAIELLQEISECDEVGLGSSKNRKGLKISKDTAKEILDVFYAVTKNNRNAFEHFEVIQLYVNNISKDRISDIACNILKSFLIDFTIDACKKYNIPMKIFDEIKVFNHKTCKLDREPVELPYNPENNLPIILVPKRWLRYTPWINYDNYFKGCHSLFDKNPNIKEKADILNYNRNNYNVIELYISEKERSKKDCKNDPLFKQIPILSAKKTLKSILSLSTGKKDNSDKLYEEEISKLFASLLYPHLDFAASQSRTISNVNIRDLVFYNNRSYPFLKDLYDDYKSKQIVFEMKNVLELNNDNIDQLNRYLTSQFGNFGVIITRNEVKKHVMKNFVDLWSGQRKCILVLTDLDIEMMVQVYESKQRDPIEVLKKKYVEFMRLCPS